jgi:uncharacterized membrane protein
MLFGNTELALRSMSVFFGAIAVVIGYLLTRRLFDRTAARLGLLFMVISPMLIRYSQEARMYTLVAAIALAATYTLVIAINSKKRLPWVIYGVLVGLGMLTHYFSAIVWIAHWIWRADTIYGVSKTKEFVKKFLSKEWILAHIIALLVFLPWFPFFFMQVLTVQVFGFWIPPVTPDTMINFLSNVLFYWDTGEIQGWFALGFMAITILIGILAFRTCDNLKDTKQIERRQSFRLIAALAFAPIILLFLMSMPPLRSTFIDRYLITSAIGIAIFIGVTLSLGIKQIGKEWRNLAIILVVGFMIIGVFNVWRLGNYNKTMHSSNNTRQIIETIERISDKNQPIIANTPWLFYEAVFYSTDSHPVYFIEAKDYKYGSLDMLKYNDQYKIKDINAFTKDNAIVWYIGYIGGGDFGAPYPNWEPIQETWVNDSVSNKKAYKAIQFKISN